MVDVCGHHLFGDALHMTSPLHCPHGNFIHYKQKCPICAAVTEETEPLKRRIGELQAALRESEQRRESLSTAVDCSESVIEQLYQAGRKIEKLRVELAGYRALHLSDPGRYGLVVRCDECGNNECIYIGSSRVGACELYVGLEQKEK